MNDKAFLYIIVFFFLIIMGRVASNWLMREVYDSAGVTLEEVYKKRAEVRHRKSPQRHIVFWLESVSPEPERTKRLLKAYHLLSMPAIVCLGVSVTGLFTHIFDRFLDISSMAVLALVLITAFAGIVYPKRKR